MSDSILLSAPPSDAVSAVTHVHTLHSWDSRTPIRRTVDALFENGASIALVSDHNSYAGSWQARAEAGERGIDISIPTAAEVRTDRGDVIVVFDHDDPPPIEDLMVWKTLPDRVRDAGGLVWIPHPFQSHIDVEGMAPEADVIEVFNARCSEAQNAKSADLCVRHGKVAAVGFDAHLHVELSRMSVQYERQQNVLDTFRRPPFCAQTVRTRPSDLAAAEVIYGVHRRKPRKIGYFGARWAIHRLKGN